MQLVEIAGAPCASVPASLCSTSPTRRCPARERAACSRWCASSRAEGVTVIYRLAPPARGARPRRPHHRDARRAHHRDARQRRSCRRRRLIRAMVGRELARARPWSLDPAAARVARSSCFGRELDRARPRPRRLRGPRRRDPGHRRPAGFGQGRLGEALFGLAPAPARVTIDGRVLRLLDPAGSIRNGLAFVPADRRGAGGLLAMSVADNVVSASLPRFSVAGLLRRAAIRREARAQVARLDARIARLGQKAAHPVGRQPAEDHPRPQPRHRSARAGAARADRAASMSGPRPRSTPSCAPSPGTAWPWC